MTDATTCTKNERMSWKTDVGNLAITILIKRLFAKPLFFMQFLLLSSMALYGAIGRCE